MNWKKRTVILIGICLILLIAYSFWCNDVKTIKCALTNTSALENTYYFMQILVGTALILGAVIGVWQYVLTARSERARIKNDRIQRAIDLAEYYKDNILPEFIVFQYIFVQSGIKKILDEIKPKDMVRFDREELNDNLSVAKREQLLKIMSSKEMINILRAAEKIYAKEFSLLKGVDEEGGELIANHAMKAMSNALNKVLNNMEYFAMHFTHKTADETVVFQSLHQTYLKYVQLFYYNIAINNEKSEQKFFENVVQLYHTWYNENNKRKEEARRHPDLGNKADDV